MQVMEIPMPIPGAAYPVIDAQQLEYIAFSGQQELVHGVFKSIPLEERRRFASKYILSEVITGGIKKLRKYLGAAAEEAADEEKAFIDQTLRQFILGCRNSRNYPRELFQSILQWANELVALSLPNEAVYYYEEALRLDPQKYPDLHARLLLDSASVLNTFGEFSQAQSILTTLAERPYLITDRNIVPALMFNLGRESLLNGDVGYYKELLFRGLREFYGNIDDRRIFVEQLCKTYRRFYHVLLGRSVRVTDKVVFLLHWAYFRLSTGRAARRIGIVRMMRLLVLGWVYITNYARASARPQRSFRGFPAAYPRAKRHHVLLTRAMGGIGDFLMMTPGLHALKRKHPREEIHVAVPRRYAPLFEGNPDVKVVDIEDVSLSHLTYRKWLNFSDCPATRIEALTSPRVKRSRVDIFARAMGIRCYRFWTMDKRPRYFVSDGEKSFAAWFWNVHQLAGRPVIAVQLHAEEVYRNYPHMQRLVRELAKKRTVLLFDSEIIDGFDLPNVIKVDTLPMRQAFALVSRCDAVVAPDSSFVHLAAALDLPCVALYGPIDGTVRTAHYPNCIYLDVRDRLGCVPCWRNDQIPCKLTGLRNSVCLHEIAVRDIIQTLDNVLERRTP